MKRIISDKFAIVLRDGQYFVVKNEDEVFRAWDVWGIEIKAVLPWTVFDMSLRYAAAGIAAASGFTQNTLLKQFERLE